MDLLEAIFTRRSVRSYTAEPITPKQLAIILKAGFQAPSAHDRQPCHYIVVRDKEKLGSISEFHPHAKMIVSAGCGIIVCGDKKSEGQTGYIVEDCSAVMENMLLAAHASGLGAVWCVLYPLPVLIRRARQLLEIPADVVPVGMVVVGNKKHEKPPIDRFKEERVHYDCW